MSDEEIRSCDEIRAVIGAQARFAARVMSTPQSPLYPAFRLVGRHRDTGELVGLSEWTRSRETGELVPTGEVFTACQWEHRSTDLAA
ncbi:hypothetical protein ACFQ8S_06750 [Streptomyces virginiae]|uniref:hypothetical protein n=1 Tax=Streptomyces virginiae TaxID=1961 RepID=UPI0036775F2E